MKTPEHDDDGMVELDRALAQLPPPGAPQGFRAAVMRRVAEVQASFSFVRRARRFVSAARVQAVSGRHVQAPGGATAMKKVLWATAGVAALIVISSLVVGYPPLGTDTSGTIGAASQAQSQTVAPSDAEVNAFLESESFARLWQDPGIRAVLRRAATDEALAKALTMLSSDTFRKAIESKK